MALSAGARFGCFVEAAVYDVYCNCYCESGQKRARLEAMLKVANMRVEKRG